MTDPRSALASKIMNANPNAYEALVVQAAASPLAHELLDNVQPNQLVSGVVSSSSAASGLLAGLWLWHDELAESHKISQALHDETGSFWHAIMHRREGDFSNSKYWYDRCADHPILQSLAIRAGDVINSFPADKSVFRITAHGWDSAALVDLVEQIHEKQDDPRHRLAVALQKIEWQTLFDHCLRTAVGR